MIPVALRAVDEAILFKRAVRGIAARHGRVACFMAKPFAQQAGSGMHLHASAQCDAKSGFMKAGPILSLNSRKRHGYLAKGGPLTGDLPNQFAGADGRLKASTVTNAFTLGNGKRSIFNRDGVSLIVKKRGDDYRTQPIGNSGDRIACGTVVRTQGTAPRRFPAKPAQNARP